MKPSHNLFRFVFSSDRRQPVDDATEASQSSSASSLSRFSSKISGKSRMLSRSIFFGPPALPSLNLYAKPKVEVSATNAILPLPSAADVLRVTQTLLYPQRCDMKRRYEPEPEEEDLSKLSDYSSGSPRLIKRQRLDTYSDSRTSDSDMSISPMVEEVHHVAQPSHPVTFEPTLGDHSHRHPRLASPPMSVGADNEVHRVGNEPQAISLWISHLLNDRLTENWNRHALGHSRTSSFLNDRSMRSMCDWLVQALDKFNPSNNTLLVCLIFFERILKHAVVRDLDILRRDVQSNRKGVARVLFILALDYAFMRMDDVMWTFAVTAEWLEMGMKRAKLYKKWGLSMLRPDVPTQSEDGRETSDFFKGCDLTVSRDLWFESLEIYREHAQSCHFHPDVADIIENLLYNGEEDVRETLEAQDVFLARVPPPAPEPPIVVPGSPRRKRISRTLADELRCDRNCMNTPFPSFIPNIPDEDVDEDMECCSPYSCYSQCSDEGYAETWDHCDDYRHVPVLQPQPVYHPSYIQDHRQLLSVVA